VLLSNHIFVIFFSFRCVIPVNLCLNRSFFTFIFAVLLHFCTCYVVQGPRYGVRGLQSTIFRCSCSLANPTKFGTKVVIVTFSPNTSCVPNLKLLASMDAKISRGSHFLDAPLAHTIANCGRKSCFLVSYSPTPSCIPKLKLLASVAAKISRRSQFFGCSQSPINFGPKSCFW